MLPDGTQPFHDDIQAIQQLAIALSGTGDIVAAVARLRELNARLGSAPETLGILAGRFKRQWQANPAVTQIGWRALQLYKDGFELARAHQDHDQVIYNGINAAYLNFALAATDFPEVAQQVLEAVAAKGTADYWAEVSRAEAYLLLGRYTEAAAAYGAAQRLAPAPRQWTTTAQQALDILRRRSFPVEAATLQRLFEGVPNQS